MRVLLPATGDLLRLARVGSCLVACALLGFASCKKNEPIDEAKATDKTTVDFPQITDDIFKPMDVRRLFIAAMIFSIQSR